MNLDKLKESARKYEQSGQWRQAIDVYKKALREFEESGEGVLDPSLYNRIGDLETKDGDTNAAIRAYEQAADFYTEQGFFNNAIALCSKILRANPGRTATYLRLAQLNARKNFVSDAKKNLVEYIERMDALHHREEAFAAIRMFSEQFSSNPDIRFMLVDLLRVGSRSEETRDGLGKLADEIAAQGEAPSGEPTRDSVATIEAEGETPARPDPRSGLVFLDVGAGAPVDGLDALVSDEANDAWRQDTSQLDDLEFTNLGSTDQESVPDLVTEAPFGSDESLALDADDGYPDIDAYPSVEGGDLTSEGEALLSIEPEGEAEADDLVFLPVDNAEQPDPVIAPEDTQLEDVGSYARDRARMLFEVGDREGGVAALEEALRQFEGTGRLQEALQIADDLIRLEPDAVFRYQKRVEVAYRAGDHGAMIDSYLGLADALLRGGGLEHAVTVYRRVLEHSPDNPQARSALAMLEASRSPAAPEPPAQPADAFVDLGSLILDDTPVRDTRMRIDQAAPIEDEDAAFVEALSQFKRGIEENIDAEDFQAHYDLGIAFKEMGLLDEAIAQFQKALRAPEGRLKTSEQLGVAFFDKSRYAIAEAVLRRAIDSLPGDDEEKIGSMYWLGRALEAQRRFEEALKYYERALAVDIRFLDVSDRVMRLTTGAS
ncbi:MAG: tetratricopeptide repeat protein [Gemmatimonadales bacterium]